MNVLHYSQHRVFVSGKDRRPGVAGLVDGVSPKGPGFDSRSGRQHLQLAKGGPCDSKAYRTERSSACGASPNKKESIWQGGNGNGILFLCNTNINDDT